MALPSRAASLVALCVVFWILAIAAVIFRLWSRRIKSQRLLWNDYACLVALVFTSGVVICNIVAVADGGVGYHTKLVSMSEQLVSLKIYTVVWILQAAANTFVRLSFLHLLLKIFGIQKWFKSTVWLLTGLTVAYMVGCLITFFALCTPFEANWNPMAPHAHCGNRYLPFLLSAVFNFLLDLAIIIAPMPLLWGLQTSVDKKWALTIVFGCGTVVCVMTVLRTVAVVDFNPIAAKLDFTYTVYYDALWSSLEPSLGVVNTCLPVMAPVIQKASESTIVAVLLGTRKSRQPSSSRKYNLPKKDRPFDRLSNEEDGYQLNSVRTRSK